MQIETLDEEKPFLDHLDDLRSTIVRMALTLIVMTVVCFSFAPELMDILRRPVDQVWDMYEESHLNGLVSTQDWQKAKDIVAASNGLNDHQKELVYEQCSEKEKELISCVNLVKAVQVIPIDKQEQFIQKASPNPEIAKLTTQLTQEGAILTETGGYGSLKMMGAFQPGEAFILSMKLALYAGIVLSFPLLLYFILQFIVPGLHNHEQKLLYKCLGIGFGLFLVGTCFCYWIVLPRILTFFFTYSLDMGIANEWRIGYYLSFATQLILLFGLAFELPVIVMPFVKMGILTYDMMKSTRRYAIVAIAILAAIITPTPDMATMSLMAVPMYALYEICILMAWMHERKERKKEQSEADSDALRLKEEYENNDSPYHLN